MKNKLIFGAITTVAVGLGIALVRWYSKQDVNEVNPKNFFKDEPTEECDDTVYESETCFEYRN